MYCCIAVCVDFFYLFLDVCHWDLFISVIVFNIWNFRCTEIFHRNHQLEITNSNLAYNTLRRFAQVHLTSHGDNASLLRRHFLLGATRSVRPAWKLFKYIGGNKHVRSRCRLETDVYANDEFRFKVHFIKALRESWTWYCSVLSGGSWQRNRVQVRTGIKGEVQ